MNIANDCTYQNTGNTGNTGNNRLHFLETAREIGARLVSKALWDKDRCNWLGSSIEPVDEKYQVVIRTFGVDMYNGTTGIAYFLSQLYSAAPDETLAITLEGAINQYLSIYDQDAAGNLGNFGLYSGKVGLAYVLVTAGKILGRQEWLEKALDILKTLENKKPNDEEVDIVSGAAGAIPALLKLHAYFGKEFIKQLAIRCGDFLLEKAEKSDQGLSWNIMPGKFNLTGYSHGAAGVAASLMELSTQTRDTRYLEAAVKGFQYERHFFNPQEGNWYDLRDESFNRQKQSYVSGMAWCHGAPGIALSRLKAYRLSGDESYLREAETALQSTLNSLSQSIQTGLTTVGENFSLCHGLAGNADILISGALALNRPQLLQWAEYLGNSGIEKYAKFNAPWPSGVTDINGMESNLETPGLMLGLAGTGYFFLRLFDPIKFESILCL